jgi:hypothetical protein
MSTATFSFQQAFNINAGCILKVEISTDGGVTFQPNPLLQYTGPMNLGNPNVDWVTTSIDLSDYLGLSNLVIRWNYRLCRSNWAIDNAGIASATAFRICMDINKPVRRNLSLLPMILHRHPLMRVLQLQALATLTR